jgi:copper chaperone
MKEVAMRFRIENMTCGGCARGVTKAVQSIDPQAQVSADVAARLVDVTSTQSAANVGAALYTAGFPAALQPSSGEAVR